MNVPVVLMAVAAGIAIDATITHAVVGLGRRPRDDTHIAFAIEALAVAVGAIAIAVLYSAASPYVHVAVMKWVLFPAGAAWVIATVWMVAFYTGVRPQRFLIVLTVAFLAVLAIDLALPYGLLHQELGSVHHATVYGADVILLDDPEPHPLNILANGLTLMSFAFMAYAAWRMTRQGKRSRALIVWLFVGVFALASVADALADYGLISSLYLTQLSFAALVVCVSVVLRRQSLRDERILATYRTHLESLVEERVRELDHTNARLSEEVAERLTAEAKLRKRVRELAMLQEFSQTFAYRSDLASALADAEPLIAALFDAKYARCRFMPTPGRLDPTVPIDISCEDRAIGVGAAFEALNGDRLRTFSGPDWPGLPDALRERAEAEQVDQLLLVQLSVPTGPVGTLSVGRQGEAFDKEEQTLARTVADNLARVIENERLREAQARQVAEKERQHLARELHDAVTQTIYSAALIAEALPTVWERRPSEALHNLERLRRLVRGALAEMRTLLFELRPSALEAATLDALVDRLGDALSGQIQVPVEIEVPKDIALPADVKLALYRVVQEAFSNIAKHARASRVTLTVDKNEDEIVTLVVQDDGSGFDPCDLPPERMGLRIMRERLDRIQASLSVHSIEGVGTTIAVAWPAPPKAASEGRRDERPRAYSGDDR